MGRVQVRERTLVIDRPALSPLASGSAGGRRFASPVLEVAGGFRRAVPSWNVRLGAGQGFALELRVGRGEEWSPHLFAGGLGWSPGRSPRVRAARFGTIEVDEFVAAAEPLGRLQLRVSFIGAGADPAERLRRVALAFDAVEDAFLSAGVPLAARRLEVPFRSQFDGTGELGPRLCGPTCLAMVLAYYGIDRPTREVAEACYDARHDVYGNWPGGVQTAFEYGLPGYVKRFAGWSEAAAVLGRDRPVIASVRFGAGELPGAAVPETKGHLVVVTGFTGRDEVRVNDPAFVRAAGGVRTYPGEAFARAWFGGSGVGYVLGE